MLSGSNTKAIRKMKQCNKKYKTSILYPKMFKEGLYLGIINIVPKNEKQSILPPFECHSLYKT